MITSPSRVGLLDKKLSLRCILEIARTEFPRRASRGSDWIEKSTVFGDKFCLD
jgi:hypothetical protein